MVSPSKKLRYGVIVRTIPAKFATQEDVGENPADERRPACRPLVLQHFGLDDLFLRHTVEERGDLVI
jgi:hypothetical protein